jgi:isoquinoline 1-oxidoreductase beta subunit
MEPMNCTADVRGDKAEVWAPTQNPPMAAEAVAKVLGIAQENVTVHVMRSGGGFGRRFYADFITDTVLLSRQFKRPVKVIWPREDDIRHDYFRPANVQRIRAATSGGKISHWQQKVVSHPREIYLERDGSAAEIGNYEFPAGFVPNLLFEYSAVPARIPLGQWRATDHSGNVFAVSARQGESLRCRNPSPSGNPLARRDQVAGPSLRGLRQSERFGADISGGGWTEAACDDDRQQPDECSCLD